MKEVCNVVFQGVLAYCVNTLQIDSDTSYPDLESETDPVEDLFCTLLYNDETHTFDQVSAQRNQDKITTSSKRYIYILILWF